MQRNDESERLRRAIKENKLFLVRRIAGRLEDIRNVDPDGNRWTSLAWAAICAHEEVFTFFLDSRHDDDELSRDIENNTILILLAGSSSISQNTNHVPSSRDEDAEGAALRMARAYLGRYPYLIDWSNVKGKTALHVASLKGNEEFVRMLCDYGADFDLPDEEGNTPLHFASAWGHVSIVQLLIERGCQFVTKNNHGFTASDYAFSNNTMNVLQETARSQFESNKRARRNIYAQAASRANELQKRYEPPYNAQIPRPSSSNRLRSGSGTSASDPASELDASGTPYDSAGYPMQSRPHQSSLPSSTNHTSSASPLPPPKVPPSVRTQGPIITDSDSPPPLPPKGPNFQRITPSRSLQQLSSSSADVAPNTPASSRRQPSIDLALSPVASRVRQRDADAIAQYLSRTRTTSTESESLITPSTNGSSSVSIRSRSSDGGAGYALQSPLRPSASASVLRSPDSTFKKPGDQLNHQHRYRSTTIDSLPETKEEITVGYEPRERANPYDATTSQPDLVSMRRPGKV